VIGRRHAQAVLCRFQGAGRPGTPQGGEVHRATGC
jgi:hypothetical protein